MNARGPSFGGSVNLVVEWPRRSEELATFLVVLEVDLKFNAPATYGDAEAFWRGFLGGINESLRRRDARAKARLI